MAALLVLISYIISVITVGLCLFLKVPQIINLYKFKRTGALSIKGLLLELTSYTTTLCYNYVNGYSLLTYLEYPIILLQNLVLIFLALFYKRLINQRCLLWCGLYLIITSAFLFRIIPSPFLTLLAPLCTPISAWSKVIQLMAIVRSKSSQGISMMTWFISSVTNLSRAFTVYLDSADSIILCNLGISALLSSLIMAATYYYRYYRPWHLYNTQVVWQDETPNNTPSADASSSLQPKNRKDE